MLRSLVANDWMFDECVADFKASVPRETKAAIEDHAPVSFYEFIYARVRCIQGSMYTMSDVCEVGKIP